MIFCVIMEISISRKIIFMEPNQNPMQNPNPLASPMNNSATSPMANQMPTSGQPTNAGPQMTEVQSVMEQQMDAILNEPMQGTQPMGPVQPMQMEKPKTSKAMICGLICAIILAVAGIGFGAFMMISGSQTEDNLNKQIATLKKQNSDLNVKVSELQNTLTGDTALQLLNDAAISQGLGYSVAYANVYAAYDGDEDITSYWVKYMPTNVPEGAVVASDIIFTMNEDGDWEFVMPGFTEATPEILNSYKVITAETEVAE